MGSMSKATYYNDATHGYTCFVANRLASYHNIASSST